MAESTHPSMTFPDRPPVLVPSLHVQSHTYDLAHAKVALATLHAEQLVAAVPPFPIFAECHGHPKANEACPQCAGTHEHRWKAWLDRPEIHQATGYMGPQTPVRCMDCGARKCDMGNCSARRHHRGEHVPY